jgi:hypothetical protein
MLSNISPTVSSIRISAQYLYGLADGGNGLREVLEAKFTNFQFILDHSHLKQHLYQAVEAMDFPRSVSSIWFKCALDLIEHGKVKKIISRLKRWSGQGQKVVLNFSKYLGSPERKTVPIEVSEI